MGDALTRQGDEGSEFFVIVDGDASAAVDGDEVGTIGPGGFFGEMALIDGGERVATVTATSPMQLLVLDRHDFNEMLELAMPQIAPEAPRRRRRAHARHRRAQPGRRHPRPLAHRGSPARVRLRLGGHLER